MKSRFVAERRMDVPAQVAYHCLADYREHHRPDGFLPPAFSAFEVHRGGGIGAGTEVSWTVDLAGGRARRLSAAITEPEPGRRLVETGDGVVTTFTVAPSDGGCAVRFDTVFDEAGLDGVLLRLFIGRMLGPLYADKLERLDGMPTRTAGGGRNVIADTSPDHPPIDRGSLPRVDIRVVAEGARAIGHASSPSQRGMATTFQNR
jgi:hypothetical protein